MKITFLLPYAAMSGGVRVIAIYADLLRDRGHQVRVISVSKKPLSFKKNLRSVIKEKKLPYKKIKQGKTYFHENDRWWTVVNHPGPITNNDVPDADIVVATWWKTAEWAHQLSARKGLKIYFCQGYETHHRKYRRRVEATYSLKMEKICVSDWVREKIQTLNGRCENNVVPNGVDLQLFYHSKNVIRDSQCFGFMFSNEYIKGVDIILKALILAKEKNPQIKAIAFGSRQPIKDIVLPQWVEFHENPPQEFIREIYSRCSAWLFGSRAEGFGLPILEAMACQTPVIATPAGAAPDLISESSGFIVPHEDSRVMAEKILETSRINPLAWEKLSESAYQVAKSNQWGNSVTKFEKILMDAL